MSTVTDITILALIHISTRSIICSTSIRRTGSHLLDHRLTHLAGYISAYRPWLYLPPMQSLRHLAAHPEIDIDGCNGIVMRS